MELNWLNIKNIDSNSILLEIFSSLTEIYKSYKFLDISEEDFKNIVISEIDKSKLVEKTEEPYIKYIQNKVRNNLFIQVKQRLSDPNKEFEITSKYLESKGSEEKNIIDCLKLLQKFLVNLIIILLLN